MLKRALVEKGTNFFSQGRQNQHFSLECEVQGHNPEIAQLAEKSYVALRV